MRTLDELLASDVELVVIGTPSPTHYALTKQALLAGKHVVCDKPVTTTLAQAEDLEATAKAQGKLLFPFQNRRWDGDFMTMCDLITGGKVGRVVTLDSRFDRYRPQPKPGAWREEEEGGGLLFDIGPHLIDQALTLFGRPNRIFANLRNDRDAHSSVPDAFDLDLYFTGPEGRDVLVRLGTTVLATDPGPRYRLEGTRRQLREIRARSAGIEHHRRRKGPATRQRRTMVARTAGTVGHAYGCTRSCAARDTDQVAGSHPGR